MQNKQARATRTTESTRRRTRTSSVSFLTMKKKEKLGRCSWGCKQHRAQKWLHTWRQRLHYPLILSDSEHLPLQEYLRACVRACLCISVHFRAREREKSDIYLSAWCRGQTTCLPDKRWLSNLGKIGLSWHQFFPQIFASMAAGGKKNTAGLLGGGSAFCFCSPIG